MSRTPMTTAASLLAALALLAACATPLPQAREDIAVPPAQESLTLAAPPADWSAHLGRRVRIAVPLTVSGNRDLVREGTLVASFGGRLFAPTERALPGAAANALADENAHRRLVLRLPHPPQAAAAAPWRSGSALAGVEGVVAATDGDIVLAIERPPRISPAPRPPMPRLAGDVRLASLNLQNLFNGDGRGGGFPTTRGARTHAGYLHQRGKLVATLQALDADVVALMELESDGDGPQSSLAQLVAALNGREGPWRYVPACAPPCTGAAATDRDALAAHPIRVGMVYRADRVTPVGAPALLSGAPFGERSRVPMAQAFRAGDGPAFTVVAVHFKSKGCSEAADADRDQGDGQACWNATRLDSARRLGDWLRGDPTRSGSDLVAILGDLNAYALEDPIRHLQGLGWTDALAGAPTPYTYVYDAQAGRLDHALLSPALAGRLADAAIWHANADEAPNVGDPAANDADSSASPWRSSDHDPVVLGLHLRMP